MTSIIKGHIVVVMFAFMLSACSAPQEAEDINTQIALIDKADGLSYELAFELLELETICFGQDFAIETEPAKIDDNKSTIIAMDTESLISALHVTPDEVEKNVEIALKGSEKFNYEESASQIRQTLQSAKSKYDEAKNHFDRRKEDKQSYKAYCSHFVQAGKHYKLLSTQLNTLEEDLEARSR
jgi:chaperonin cofactor prefoldin